MIVEQNLVRIDAVVPAVTRTVAGPRAWNHLPDVLNVWNALPSTVNFSKLSVFRSSIVKVDFSSFYRATPC